MDYFALSVLGLYILIIFILILSGKKIYEDGDTRGWMIIFNFLNLIILLIFFSVFEGNTAYTLLSIYFVIGILFFFLGFLRYHKTPLKVSDIFDWITITPFWPTLAYQKFFPSANIIVLDQAALDKILHKETTIIPFL